jgi:hypothetical protein
MILIKLHKHRSRCFGITGANDIFFLTLDILFDMLLNFPRYLSILLLQTSKTDNNALDIDAIYNLKLRKTEPNSTDSFTTKLNAKFPWPPIMPKQRECILHNTYVDCDCILQKSIIRRYNVSLHLAFKRILHFVVRLTFVCRHCFNM